MRFISIALSSLLLLAASAQAEDLGTIFGRVNEFVAKQNYAKALEELSWAKKELEHKHSEKLQSFFPAQLGDFAGGKFEANSALGFTNIERSYSKGTSSVKISLTGGSGGSDQALGGLAALGKMAALFGQQAGQDTFRIAGRTATMQKQEGSDSAELTVFLDSGSILKFEQDSEADTTALRTLAEKFDLNALDTYLKGQA